MLDPEQYLMKDEQREGMKTDGLGKEMEILECS